MKRFYRGMFLMYGISIALVLIQPGDPLPSHISVLASFLSAGCISLSVFGGKQ